MLYDVQKMMAQLEAIEKGSGPKSIYCIQSSSVVQSWMLAFESKPHPGVSIPHTTWPGCTSGPNYLVPPGLAAPQAQTTSHGWPPRGSRWRPGCRRSSQGTLTAHWIFWTQGCCCHCCHAWMPWSFWGNITKGRGTVGIWSVIVEDRHLWA